MNRIVLDAALLQKLGDLKEAAELCDESGRVLGKLYPVFNLDDYEAWVPPMDEEELRRREESNDWITTDELLDEMEKL